MNCINKRAKKDICAEAFALASVLGSHFFWKAEMSVYYVVTRQLALDTGFIFRPRADILNTLLKRRAHAPLHAVERVSKPQIT